MFQNPPDTFSNEISNPPELQEAIPENDRATAGAILAVGPSDNLGGDCQYKQ